jgi:hypothetical protein
MEAGGGGAVSCSTAVPLQPDQLFLGPPPSRLLGLRGGGWNILGWGRRVLQCYLVGLVRKWRGGKREADMVGIVTWSHQLGFHFVNLVETL